MTIGFDGVADQMTACRSSKRTIDATFFVNSGVIGDAEHMSWADLHTLADAGHDRGPHAHHVNVKPLKEEDARLEVCGDRVNLWNNGFQPTSFAYPFGGFDAGSEAVVAACGYNSGRTLRAWTAPGRSRDDPTTGRIRHADPATPSRARRSTR